MKTCLFLCLTFLSLNTFAVTQNEIAHLLQYVASTDCQYERNGSLHKGAQAAQHIQKKYDYFKDKIKSAEDFIKYSATKSKMSGRFYSIHCIGEPTIQSKQWLLDELKRFRARN